MDALSGRIEDRITDRDDVHVRTLLLRRCHREAVTSGNAYGDLTLAARLLLTMDAPSRRTHTPLKNWSER